MRTSSTVRAAIPGTVPTLASCVPAAQTLAKPAMGPIHGTTHLVVGQPGTQPQRRAWKVILAGPGTVSS